MWIAFSYLNLNISHYKIFGKARSSKPLGLRVLLESGLGVAE